MPKPKTPKPKTPKPKPSLTVEALKKYYDAGAGAVCLGTDEEYSRRVYWEGVKHGWEHALYAAEQISKSYNTADETEDM